MNKRHGIISVLGMALGLVAWFLWPRPPAPWTPADPNPFVRKIVIENIDDKPVPVGEVVTIPADKGVYLRIDLELFEDFPATIGSREVAPPHRWPITFAVYRLGKPQSPTAKEFKCFCPTDLVEIQPRDQAGKLPPPFLPRVGIPGLSLKWGANGVPQAASAEKGHVAFWTFIHPPDVKNPAGEYVYEIRLYPTARWISKIRSESGDPIVIQRGLLIAQDAPDTPQAAKTTPARRHVTRLEPASLAIGVKTTAAAG